jgi:FkbM family methyltransferase
LVRLGTKIRNQQRQERVVDVWFREKGDKTLRLNYELDPSSLVLDLGGYEGQWSSDIFSMYQCSIQIFEPVEEFASEIEARFSRQKKITIHKFGLSAETREARVNVDRDATSIFKSGSKSGEIRLVKASDFFERQQISYVDLMKINIEGGEYELLEHLLDCGLTTRIENIQVQFHDFVPNAEKRMNKIQYRLGKTHTLTYQYPFVWENWRLRA